MDSYSIVIRTLGFGGKNYKALLESIRKQTIKPKHVYVFIAEGYELPQERLGNEEFIYCEKGMWKQRVYGMEYTTKYGDSEYQLVIDDDISFEENFVEVCLSIVKEYNADILIPGISENGNKPYTTPSSIKKRLITGFIGSRFETKKSDYQIEILSTAGFKVNVNNQQNVRRTQSGTFAAFIIKSSVFPILDLRIEEWIDMTKYSLPDDQLFFYKAHCKGLRLYSCKEPFINHLDSGSSQKGRLNDIAFASGRNIYIFWHRFLYLRSIGKKRIKLTLAINYRLFNTYILYFIKGLVKHDFSILKSYYEGVRQAKEFIKSEEYKKLPLV